MRVQSAAALAEYIESLSALDIAERILATDAAVLRDCAAYRVRGADDPSALCEIAGLCASPCWRARPASRLTGCDG